MIAKPVSPRLVPQLREWDEAARGELELDQVFAKNLDLSSSSKVNIDGSIIESCSITAQLDKFELTDVKCIKLEGAGLQAYKANLLRVLLSDARLTGAEFAEGHFEDCTFRNIKLDETGFRFTSFKRVRFENCVLRQADFSNAKLNHVVFDGCDLEGTNFISANCTEVDISGEDLTLAKGILGLKGAIISTEQLIQLAPLLASELGFHVKDES